MLRCMAGTCCLHLHKTELYCSFTPEKSLKWLTKTTERNTAYGSAFPAACFKSSSCSQRVASFSDTNHDWVLANGKQSSTAACFKS